MKTKTFQEQLTEAKAHRDEARARLDACSTWGKKMREAGEDFEFWSSKVAYLQAAVLEKP